MAMETVKLENKTVRKEWDDRVLEVLEKYNLNRPFFCCHSACISSTSGR